MAWWIAVFKDRDGSTEELEVSTSTTLQYEAWNKVISMFFQDLVPHCNGDCFSDVFPDFLSDDAIPSLFRVLFSVADVL